MRGPAIALWIGLRLAALGVILFGISASTTGSGPDGRLAAVYLCTALAAAGWIGWLATAMTSRHRWVLAASLALLVESGSALAGIAPSSAAQALCGLGVFAAVMALPSWQAAAVFTAGLLTLFVSSVLSGYPAGSLGTFAVVLAGIVLGAVNRRQYVARVQQAESLVEQTRQTEVEQSRAAALAERARIAREIHDVLAHSLGALAVQLDAADALLAAGRDTGRAHQHVVRARGLAVDGLAETRRAIGALRGEVLALPNRIAALCRDFGADSGVPAWFRVTGMERRLASDAELTTFRTAQEALSNARKHAPGSSVHITLAYGRTDVSLTVTNGPPPSRDDGAQPAALAGSGGGFGLTGLTERAVLNGGELGAGPEGDGWSVRLRLPQ
ncbi:MAG TPA: histidine kinase [Streptosporangiaceae bacterium]|nr:histidine kinase [Streptosporangiaceae bacterium]